VQTSKRSADSVYDEIEGLTGNRAELERERFAYIKALRSLKALRDDSAIWDIAPDDFKLNILAAIDGITAAKNALWDTIEHTDAGISRLMDLVQNGAFND